jgi:hypothetical protein
VATTVASLFGQLTRDPWREAERFSADIEAVNQALFSSTATASSSTKILGEWLQRNQPCLFGRIAAKLGFISYCVLNEADLLLPDESIQEKIQRARLQWIKDGYEGRKSNFILIVVSPAISYALPNPVVAGLAQRLCSLYLQIDARFDFVHHEHLFLEKPGHARVTWRWLAGVNYFCAQGDKRWWQDHRIPGGMAFSVNSVGHLVKSEKIARAMTELNTDLAIEDEESWADSKVDSLEKALILAMRTIDLASETVSGKATELLTLPSNVEDFQLPQCPVNEMPQSLKGKNYCEYKGYYHTDYTLPSEYFTPYVSRPDTIEPFALDFTYLFHKDVNNPDYWTMGEGQRIRTDQHDDSRTIETEDYKTRRSQPESVGIDSSELLLKALSV